MRANKSILISQRATSRISQGCADSSGTKEDFVGVEELCRLLHDCVASSFSAVEN